jgi:hypothetical protein
MDPLTLRLLIETGVARDDFVEVGAASARVRRGLLFPRTAAAAAGEEVDATAVVMVC